MKSEFVNINAEQQSRQQAEHDADTPDAVKSVTAMLRQREQQAKAAAEARRQISLTQFRTLAVKVVADGELSPGEADELATLATALDASHEQFIECVEQVIAWHKVVQDAKATAHLVPAARKALRESAATIEKLHAQLATANDQATAGREDVEADIRARHNLATLAAQNPWLATFIPAPTPAKHSDHVRVQLLAARAGNPSGNINDIIEVPFSEAESMILHGHASLWDAGIDAPLIAPPTYVPATFASKV